MTYTSEARPRTLSAAFGLATIAALIAVTALAGFAPPAQAAGSGGIGIGGGDRTARNGNGNGNGGGAGGGGRADEGRADDGEPSSAARAPGGKAKLRRGFAIPPAGAPKKVVRAIEAANRIVKGKPYCYGGGHKRWESRCYDCSGSISYMLGRKGAGVLDAPMPSGSFMRWQKRGRGRWITVFANGGHMYAEIAGLRLDTSMTAGEGPGWSKVRRRSAGYRVRHPRGL